MGIVETIVTYSGLIFMVGGFIFFLPLVKAIMVNKRQGATWPIVTTLPTAAVLWAYAITFASMELVLSGLFFWLSALSGTLTALAWTWLLGQGIKKRRRSRK